MTLCGKKLKDLMVVDLRKELLNRNQDASGTKMALVERLKKVLIDEGHDIETWTNDAKTPTESLNDCSAEESNDKGCVISQSVKKISDESLTEISSKNNNDDIDNSKLDVVDNPNQSIQQEERKQSRSCSPPSVDCSLVVDVGGGTSELDRELLGIQSTESNKKIAESHNASKSSELTENDKNKVLASHIWVNNISSTTKAIQLKQLFSKFGRVLRARIVQRSHCGGKTLCGYMEMSTMDEANKAICALHKTTHDGNLIFCVRADNKRSEDIISECKNVHSSKVAPRLTVASEKNTNRSVNKMTSSINSHRNDQKMSQIRRDVTSNTHSTFIDKKLQMMKITEKRLKRREFDLKAAEGRVRDLQRQYHSKLKEVDVEREVLRDARSRLAREREEHERKVSHKLDELRSWESKLAKAEQALRTAQEQQQRYYEAERLRQERLAAYDDEMRRRESQRRIQRKTSQSPRRSPKRYRQRGQSPDRYWQGERRQTANERVQHGFIETRPAEFVQPAPNREPTPPRKIKKTVDYQQRPPQRFDTTTSNVTDDHNLTTTSSNPTRYNTNNDFGASHQSWRRSPSGNFRSPAAQSISNRNQPKIAESRRQFSNSAGGQSNAPFDAYTLMMSEMAAYAASQTNNTSTTNPLSNVINTSQRYSYPNSGIITQPQSNPARRYN